MKPLTPEYATENNFTSIDCVKYFKPDWSDEACFDLLMEETCYPFDFKRMIKQLNNKFCIK